MPQQTAVEWLKQQYIERGETLPSGVFQEAKAMEKEQIEDAFHAGKCNVFNWTEYGKGLQDPTEYYDEKYSE